MNDREIDQALVERAQKGEHKAFELLVSKYQRRLTRLLSRFIKDEHEVNDVAQEALIKAYRALPNFRGESAFYTWLYRIGINTAKNFLATSGKRPFMSADVANEEGDILDLADQLADNHTPEAEMLNREILQTVRLPWPNCPKICAKQLPCVKWKACLTKKLLRLWIVRSARCAPAFSGRAK